MMMEHCYSRHHEQRRSHLQLGIHIASKYHHQVGGNWVLLLEAEEKEEEEIGIWLWKRRFVGIELYNLIGVFRRGRGID